MQKHRIDLSIENEFLLYAIHSNEEAYKLAFFINQKYNLHLARSKTDLEFIKNKTLFSHQLFEYTNKNTEEAFFLIQNVSVLKQQKAAVYGLFDLLDEEHKNMVLPEFKTTPYFLKIETEQPEYYEDDLLQKLKRIPSIISIKQIDYQFIKSINNLNF